MKNHSEDCYESSMKRLKKAEADWQAHKAAVEGTNRLPLREQISDLIQARFWKYLVAREEGCNRRESLKALFMRREKFIDKYIGPKEK